MEKEQTHIEHKEFLEALLEGDHPKCSRITKDFTENNYSIKELYERIYKAALYDVGELWEYNKISVATEHLSSAIVEALLNEIYASIFTTNKLEKRAVLSCVESEQHQIGLKMINDIMEINGWHTDFLGANTPKKDLIRHIHIVKPDLLALSLSVYFNMDKLIDVIKGVNQMFPQLPILVGGQAFRHGGINSLHACKNIIFKEDLESVENYIKNF